MRAMLYILGVVVGAYLVWRGVTYPFEIDMGDPSSYANNWGGPSLTGVLAVHCGPGALVLLGCAGAAVRNRMTRQPARTSD